MKLSTYPTKYRTTHENWIFEWSSETCLNLQRYSTTFAFFIEHFVGGWFPRQVSSNFFGGGWGKTLDHPGLAKSRFTNKMTAPRSYWAVCLGSGEGEFLQYPDAPCMEYLFSYIYHKNQPFIYRFGCLVRWRVDCRSFPRSRSAGSRGSSSAHGLFCLFSRALTSLERFCMETLETDMFCIRKFSCCMEPLVNLWILSTCSIFWLINCISIEKSWKVPIIQKAFELWSTCG